MASSTLRTDDLVIPQGSDITVQWPIRDAAGQPLASMTGWTARAQARARMNRDSELLAEWTTEDGGITIESSALSLTVSSDVSSAWTWRQARYDIELVDPQGKVTRLTEGTMTLAPEVTQ